MNIKKSHILHTIANRYIAAFALLAILCYLFPYTHDDWGWGSQKGLDLLSAHFSGYGGRYFGYLISLAIMRSVFLKTLYMSGVIVGISVCIEKVIKRKWAFWLSLLLFMLMPATVFSEGISWISAFANYGTSSLVVMIFSVRAIKILRQEKVSNTPLSLFAFFLLGLLGSMILEYVTIYLVLASATLIVFSKVKYKHVDMALWAILAGSAGGAILMFTNPAYSKIIQSSDQYRSVAKQGRLEQLKTNGYTIIRHGFINNFAINICLLISLITPFLKRTIKNKVQIITTTIFGLFICYSVAAHFLKIGDFPKSFLTAEVIFALFGAIAFLILIAHIAIKHRLNKEALSIIFATFSILIILAPLFFVNPIGPRCFVVSYVLFTLLCCLLMESTLTKLNKAILKKELNVKLHRIASAAYILILISTYGFYFTIYGSIHIADIERINTINKAIENNQSEIVIKDFPFIKYTHFSTPANQLHENYFRDFYGIPDTIELKMKNR